MGMNDIMDLRARLSLVESELAALKAHFSSYKGSQESTVVSYPDSSTTSTSFVPEDGLVISKKAPVLKKKK